MKPKTCTHCQRTYAVEGDFLKGTSRWRQCTSGHLWFNCSCQSTLMLTKGTYKWFSPDMFMSKETASLFGKISKIRKLPYIPTVVMEVQEKVNAIDMDIADLAHTIRREPLFAAKIVQLSQSHASFRRPDGEHGATVEHAITYLGTKTIGDIAIIAALRGLELNTTNFTIDTWWREGFIVGALGEALVGELGFNFSKDEIYLGGSLANIGKLIQAYIFPKQTEEIYEIITTPKSMTTWSIAEEAYDLDHSALGKVGACLWGMPGFVADAAGLHHDWKRVGTNPTANTIIMLANNLMHWVTGQPDRIDEEAQNHALKVLGLSESNLEGLASKYSRLSDIPY